MTLTLFNAHSMSLFLIIVVISLFNSGLVLLSQKWRITDYYIANRKRWMPVQCDFCACFWLSVIQMMVIYFKLCPVFDLWSFLMIGVFALCSAVLSRFVL